MLPKFKVEVLKSGYTQQQNNCHVAQWLEHYIHQ
jgi:hypothetical protein